MRACLSREDPYYGTSDRRGVIAIPNVPLGKYELRVWHERALPESLDTLPASPYPKLPLFRSLRLTEQRNTSQAHKNKYARTMTTQHPLFPYIHTMISNCEPVGLLTKREI